MISQSSSNPQFLARLNYFGIGIETSHKLSIVGYQDIERFVLDATLNLKTHRVAEGVICWLGEYGHILSPSKIRKLIKEGSVYESAVLGGFVNLLLRKAHTGRSFEILRPFCKKRKNEFTPIVGPRIRKPHPDFSPYNVMLPSFSSESSKFLRSNKFIVKNCPELRNRLLFGSVVHADVASALTADPNLTTYQVSKLTSHHKATAFAAYRDVSLILTASGLDIVSIFSSKS